MSLPNAITRTKTLLSVVRAARRFEALSTRLVSPGSQVLQGQPKNSASFHTCTTLKKREFNYSAVSVDETLEGDGPWMTELKKRGVYSETRYRYYKHDIDTYSISDDKKNVIINWSDGHVSSFDAIWLRHFCHCSECKHDINGMGKIEWDSLPMDITVLSAELEGDSVMVLTWGTPDGKELHHGAIPTATLRCYCYTDKAIKERRQKRKMHFHEDKSIPAIEYEEFRASDRGLHKCLTEVNDKGICLVKNVPTNRDTFIETVKMLGPMQSSMYGDIFEVKAVENPINAAYSAAKLNLHMDLVFYETAPGLQILHCQRFDKSTQGGGSLFLDIHEVAHKFRREFPEYFNRLATLPASYNSIHYNRETPVHMENQKPIFALNHHDELVSVTWHPMVHGPTELSKKDMVPFYEAYTAFYKMVSEYESIYKSQFKDGDFLIFNNRRVLHGREAFGGGGRHLLGAFVELSDFHARTQALHNKYGGGRIASRSGSHSWF